LRPTLDGLESKLLLSTTRAQAQTHQGFAAGRGYTFQTAYGGQIVEIRTPDGGIFDVSVQEAGRIRARALKGGTVELIVDGSNSNTVLTIDPRARPRGPGNAHNFNATSAASPYLRVGKITVTSGQINQILGYRDAILSGPINITGTATVDRIAFTALAPGASITTAGTLNTLDVLNDLSLSGGPGIQIGTPGGTIGDLNSLSVGGSISLTGGSSFGINRDLGLVGQIAKGSGPSGQGGVINGNLTINPGSTFLINRTLRGPLYIFGTIIEPGAPSPFSRLVIRNVSPSLIVSGVTVANLGGFNNR